jgi:hypothetical protein
VSALKEAILDFRVQALLKLARMKVDPDQSSVRLLAEQMTDAGVLANLMRWHRPISWLRGWLGL